MEEASGIGTESRGPMNDKDKDSQVQVITDETHQLEVTDENKESQEQVTIKENHESQMQVTTKENHDSEVRENQESRLQATAENNNADIKKGNILDVQELDWLVCTAWNFAIQTISTDQNVGARALHVVVDCVNRFPSHGVTIQRLGMLKARFESNLR